MRIGHGYDAHRFTDGDFIILSGVKIPYDQTLLAHSDGDVLIHALCDALLGAAGLGDIGEHFPDSDPQYCQIDSRLLLKKVIKRVNQQQLTVSNLDITILAEAPKLASYKAIMIKNLSDDLSLSRGRINIKATTTEKMGFIGRKEGISVHAVVLLDEYNELGKYSRKL